MALQPGARLGPYEILSLIGAGGMGEVYRARDTRLGRDVAIKVLGADLTGSPEAAARFEREWHVVARLSHPNILSLYDVGQHDGCTFAVMELVPGETLRQRLAAGLSRLERRSTLRSRSRAASAPRIRLTSSTAI